MDGSIIDVVSPYATGAASVDLVVLLWVVAAVLKLQRAVDRINVTLSFLRQGVLYANGVTREQELDSD